MLKHIPLSIIYGFITLISYLGSDYSTADFKTFSVIMAWILLLCLIFNIQWFDKITDGYFVIVILLFLAARLAKYNAVEVASSASYIAVGIGLGLCVKSAYCGYLWATLFFLSIFVIEIVNVSLDPKLGSVNLEDLFISV